MNTRPLVLAAVLLGGCGTQAASQRPASTPKPAAPAGPRTLPVDTSRLHRLAPGAYRTQSGFPVPVRFSLAGPNWYGAHRPDMTWHLQDGPSRWRGRFIDVGAPFDSAAKAAHGLRHVRGLQIVKVRRTRLGGRPDIVVSTHAKRAGSVSITIVGGGGDWEFKRGEDFDFHFLTVGPDTVSMIEGGDPRYARPLNRALASLRFGA